MLVVRARSVAAIGENNAFRDPQKCHPTNRPSERGDGKEQRGDCNVFEAMIWCAWQPVGLGPLEFFACLLGAW